MAGSSYVIDEPSGPRPGQPGNDNDAMERSDGRVGWFSYTSGPHGKDHLAPEARAKVEEFEARRGRLLCQVTVMVYENDAAPGVGFPAGAAFDVETDPNQIAAAVDRARSALEAWR